MKARRRSQRFPFVDPKDLKRIVVICHRNADADAYLSAYALSALLRKVAPRSRVDIATPEGMTSLTAKLAKSFPHPVVQSGDSDYDLFVAVDVGDTELLKEWEDKMARSDGFKVLVDHHPLRDRGFYDRVVVDEKATSAAEVVVGLFRERKLKIEPKVAQALLEGIMFDSSHLAIAEADGLRKVVKLVDAGADLATARRELRSEPDYGEVLAKLKGAKRLKIYRLAGWVAATSTVGSFQAHVARSLVFLGADVAVVGGESEGETRVSLRSTQRFFEKTKLQLGTYVAEGAAKQLEGHGGGHATAASFSTKAGEGEAVSKALGIVAEFLGADVKEVD